MLEPPSSYRAPAWLRGPHAQTIYPVFRGGPLPGYRRERWETPDDDFIDIDWLDAAQPGSNSPLVVLFHGLEGSSSSHYAKALMRLLGEISWRGAVVHFRGCSGCLNLLPRAYHSGDSAEIDWVLRRMRASQAGRIYVVGISLGGNAVLKWLGEQETAATRVIDAAAAVCAPVNLAAAGAALERGANRIYTRHFLQALKRHALRRLQRHPGLYSKERMLAARTLHDFDDVVTAPLHGFRDADEYWAKASSFPWLRAIATPTLLLNAVNDPFLPAQFLPAHEQVSRYVALEYPAEGGHVGFPSGPFPGHVDWMPRRLMEFFSQG